MEQRKCSIQIAVQFRYLAVFLPKLDVMAVDKLPRGFNRCMVIGTVEFDHAHHMAVTMTVATFDLKDCPIGAAQRIRCCGGHRRCRQSWSERKSAGGKSDKQKSFHFGVSSI